MPRPKAEEVQATCIVCDSLFIKLGNKRGMEKTTCSKTCASILSFRNQKINGNCSICGALTETSKTVLNGNLAVYCNKCTNTRYKLNCQNCGKDFLGKKPNVMFCSSTCHHDTIFNKMIILSCDHCNIAFERPTFTVASNKRVFCSVKCSEARYALENPTRYGGTYSAWRKKIVERDNGKCLKCNSKDKLELHHFKKVTSFVNPNDAHYHENLILVCHSCHQEIEDIDIKDLSDFHRRYSPNTL